MLLGCHLEDSGRGRDWQRRRLSLARDLIFHFQNAFPELSYEFLPDSQLINAQAWRLGRHRFVRIYGGLVKHPALTRCGLALAFAHETGHHLGGAPVDPDMPWMTWQGQADYWAAKVCMPMLFGKRAKRMTARGALEIASLHSSMQALDKEGADLSPDCRRRVFVAGSRGEPIPSCATRALEELRLENENEV